MWSRRHSVFVKFLGGDVNVFRPCDSPHPQESLAEKSMFPFMGSKATPQIWGFMSYILRSPSEKVKSSLKSSSALTHRTVMSRIKNSYNGLMGTTIPCLRVMFQLTMSSLIDENGNTVKSRNRWHFVTRSSQQKTLRRSLPSSCLYF